VPLRSNLITAVVLAAGVLAFVAAMGVFAAPGDAPADRVFGQGGIFTGESTGIYLDGDTGEPFTDGINPDSDCGGANASSPDSYLQPDHVVVAYLECTLLTCSTLGPETLTITQNGVVQQTTFTVVGEPVTVQLSAATASIEPTQEGGCHFTADNLPDGERRATKLAARAFDANNTAITSAWLQFSVSDPSRAIIENPIWPSVALPAGGFAAETVVCAQDDASPGAVTVKVALLRDAQGTILDPFADPQNPDPNNLASDTIQIDVVAPSTPTPTPTGTPTATATSVPTLTPTAVATKTSASTKTVEATRTSISTQSPEATRSAVATLPAERTATEIPTETPAPLATRTAVATATDMATQTTEPPTLTPTSTQTATDSATGTSVASHTATATPSLPSTTPAPSATPMNPVTAESVTPVPNATTGTASGRAATQTSATRAATANDGPTNGVLGTVATPHSGVVLPATGGGSGSSGLIAGTLMLMAAGSVLSAAGLLGWRKRC
jgi:hypothetical protein